METLNNIWAWIGWAFSGALGFVLENWLIILGGLVVVAATIRVFAVVRKYRRDFIFRITLNHRIGSILAALPVRLRGVVEDVGVGILAAINMPRRYVWLALGGLIVAVLVWDFWPTCPGNTSNVKDVLACSQINRNYGLMLAGVAALFALYLNWQRTINDRRRLVNDTYVKAIEQLGHEKREVRLGAIYALERIARDAEDFDLHWSIMETLTAYIRERPAPKPPKETDAKGDSDTTEPSNATDETTVEPSLSPQIPERETPQTDIAAVSTVLKRRSETRADQEANANRRLDVRRADLPGADLSDITLLHADLRGANLTGADLTSADLASADLEHAKFSKHPQELGAIWDEANPPRGLDDIKIETT